MKNVWLVVLILAGCLLFSPAASAQLSLTGRVDSLFSDYSAKELFSGSVWIANGEQTFSSGYGLADRSWHIPNRGSTRYEIASLTKPFTAILVMQLAEQGAISLDDPLSMYLPDFPGEYGADLTLQQLLSHTSGIPNYTEKSAWVDTTSRLEVQPGEFVRIIARDELEFEPGSGFSYSNSNYYLLGIIIEKVTGMSYSRVLQERLVSPARLQNTGYLYSRMVVDSLARGYERLHDGYFEEAPFHSPTTSYAAGGIYSTVGDLYRLDQALYTDGLLSAESRNRMTNTQRNNYGLGWIAGDAYADQVPTFLKNPFTFDSGKRENGQRYRLVWHWGSNPGFNGLLLRVPEEQWTIIILENQQLLGDPEGTNIYDLAGMIFEMLAGN